MLRLNLRALLWTLGATVLSLVMLDCSRDHPRTQYVARVDGSTLTSEEVAAACDTTGGTRGQVREYINEWVITEMLYQEAVRRGIPESQGVRKQLETARRNLSVAAFLDQELALRDSTPLPDETLKAYFDSSASAFSLREDVVNISYALFSERDAANAFRSRVLRSTPWYDALQQTRTDSLSQSRLLQVVDHQYFTHASLYPEELWKLVQSLGKDAVSFVVKTTEGYYVLQAHEFKRQGSTPDFPYVKEEVRYRLQIKSRRNRYDQVLRTLREKHSIEMPVDTGATSGAEPAPPMGG